MKDSKITLTAIVPVFNEELFLNESLERLLKISVIDEIILVDDCSTDNSLKIMQKLTLKNKKIRIYQCNSNVGKGGAIKVAFKKITTDYVVIHDADLEYNPEDIYHLYNEIQQDKNKFVIGTRFTKESKPQIYKRTYFANKFLSFLFSLTYGINVSDIATCYKLIPSSYLMNTSFTENGFAIEVELLAKFLSNNKNYSEIPISYTARSYEEGKKIKFLDGLRYIFVIFKYKFI
tara:strand:- start:17979 stop:18677 length:699 start_codon:yes stop_codon:yes gene_type:complete